MLLGRRDRPMAGRMPSKVQAILGIWQTVFLRGQVVDLMIARIRLGILVHAVVRHNGTSAKTRRFTDRHRIVSEGGFRSVRLFPLRAGSQVTLWQQPEPRHDYALTGSCLRVPVVELAKVAERLEDQSTVRRWVIACLIGPRTRSRGPIAAETARN